MREYHISHSQRQNKITGHPYFNNYITNAYKVLIDQKLTNYNTKITPIL